MNVGEIVLAVQRQFGDDSGIQITRTDILRWINQACIDIARKVECVQDHKDTDSVSQDGSYILPTDMIRLRRVTYDNKVLQFTTLDVADQDWGARDVPPGTIGTPQFYYIWNNNIYLYPVPSASGDQNLDIWYIRTPAVLINDDDVLEIPARYHELITRYCLARAKELDEDQAVSNAVMADYEGQLSDAKDEMIRPNARSYNAVRLLPGDDW
jgi:hypothetical protein